MRKTRLVRNMKRRFKLFIMAMVSAVLLTGCGAVDKLSGMLYPAVSEDELSGGIPKLDVSAYNRFLFDMDITAGYIHGGSREVRISGSVELYDAISHLYEVDISDTQSEDVVTAESWADFDTDIRYTDNGNGFMVDDIMNKHVVQNLADAINTRDTGRMLTADDSVCTLSWTFPTDGSYLFAYMTDDATDDADLQSMGRITAVFDPDTHKFRYFTFVISVSDNDQTVVVLDGVFYWDAKNVKGNALQIPNDVSGQAYKASTGISTNGGYDERVNPIAEDFMTAYGGEAEVMHYNKGASMFWTISDETGSATVNYAVADDSASLYDTSYSFLVSFYGEPVEETQSDAYFYDSSAGSLTYIALDNDRYAEIIITREPGASQAALRKSLVTYKARLGI